MQSVDSSKSRNRYAEGIRNLSPELVTAIQQELRLDPRISKSELSRRVGCSRQTVLYYLRALGDLVREAEQAQHEDNRTRAVDHLGLIERIAEATDEVREEIRKLRSAGSDAATASAAFRGYGVLERLYRLLGEMLGRVSPPTTNVYLTKVEALLSSSIDESTLSGVVLDTLREQDADPATR